MFDKRHRGQVLLSDLGIGLMLAGLTTLGCRTSLLTVLKYYIVPYFWVNVCSPRPLSSALSDS